MHCSHHNTSIHYGVALVSRIDKIIGLFCKRALLKRRYSAKETYNLIDPTDRSHLIHENIHVHYFHKYLDTIAYIYSITLIKYLNTYHCSTTLICTTLICTTVPPKLSHPCNPPNRETQIPPYKFRLKQNPFLNLYRELLRNLSFSIWWISEKWCFQLKLPWVVLYLYTCTVDCTFTV